MRGLSRNDYRIAASDRPEIACDPHQIFALKHIKPFIFIQMEMKGRTAFSRVLMLHQEQSALSIGPRNLEVSGADSDDSMFTESILTSRDPHAGNPAGQVCLP